MRLIERVIHWCKEERKSLQDQLDCMEKGLFKTRSKSLGSPERDTTAESIKNCRRKIAELDELIARHPEIE